MLLLGAPICGARLSAQEQGIVDQDIVFASRDLAPAAAPQDRRAAVERAASGRLMLIAPDRGLRVLVDASQPVPADSETDVPVDVSDPDVSHDGERIVFAGYSEADKAWRIYEIRVDGTRLRRLTHSDRDIDLARYGAAADAFRLYDDTDPCYLPGGRVCFVSTRYPGGAPDGRVRANNLFVVSVNGAGIHRITSERFGADTPTVEPSTGRIIYSRFWRTVQPPAAAGNDEPEPISPGSPGYEAILTEESTQTLRGVKDEDFPGVNSWFLAGIHPDGSNLSMWSGVHLDRELTQAWKPSFLSNGDAIAIFLPVTPFLGVPRGYGLRRFSRGTAPPVALGGPQQFARRNTLPPRVNYRYASACALPDDRLVVTAAPADSFDYGIYIQENREAEPLPLFDEPESLEVDAVVVVERPVPPVIEDDVDQGMPENSPRDAEEAFAEGGSFRFLCENVHFNAPVDVAIPNAPPVGKNLRIEFYLNSQRSSPDGADLPLLIDSADIPPSGRIDVSAPAGVSLFEVLRRPDGTIGMGRDGQIFHVAGSNFGRIDGTARCVGCHTGHSMIPVPEDPRWSNLAPSAVVDASSERRHGRLNFGDFRAVNLVDRRTGSPDVEWAATEDDENVSVRLRWSTALLVREVVVHASRPGDGRIGPRDQTLRTATLVGYRREEEIFRHDIVSPIDPQGTRIDVDAEQPIDRLGVSIPRQAVEGPYEGRLGASIAEIEVIARATGDSFPAFVRGDANCDLDVNLSDAVSILDRLFRGVASLCCDAAADADDDDSIELTDAVFVLGFLFRAGDAPSEPFDECIPAPTNNLACTDSACP